MQPKDLDELDRFKLKENHSSPEIQTLAAKESDSRNKTANADLMNNTVDLAGKASGGLLSGRDKNLRNAHSLPRMGATSYGGRRGS